MTIPVPRDQAMLSQASHELEEAVVRSGLEESADLRLRLLEGAAAKIGGFDLDEYDLAVGGVNRHHHLAGKVAMESRGQASAGRRRQRYPPHR